MSFEEKIKIPEDIELSLEESSSNKKEKKLNKKKGKKKLKINESEPWNYRILVLLKKIGERSMGYKWMYNEDRKYFESTEKYLNIAEITNLAIIGTLTAYDFISFLTDSENSNSTSFFVIRILQIIFLTFLSTVKGIRDNGEYQSKIFHYGLI